MAAVYHQHFKPCTFCKAGHVAVSRNNLLNHFFCKGFYGNAIWADRVAGSPLVHAMLLAFVCHISPCIHAGVGELKAWDGAVPADGVGGVCCSGQ